MNNKLNHNFFMSRCIEVAKKGRGRTYPNPCVGCIIVNKNDIYKKIDAMKKISYENSWNNINQKLINTINEN